MTTVLAGFNAEDARRFERRGIPTEYAGVRFRSRHEAAWAALFDELKWPWAYEPTDLYGYIPDFDLSFARRPLLVEIKPLQEDYEAARAKIDRGGWTGDVAVLVSAEGAIVGELYDPNYGWDRAVLTFCLSCKRATLVQEAGGWSCRNCGAGNRELWWAYTPAASWAEAKNKVQWKAHA